MTYPQNFLDSLKFTLKWEGEYSNAKGDRGGVTMKGITQSVYDAYCFHQNLPQQTVELITDDQLHAIYFNNYWHAAGCDSVPDKLATALFDFAVNAGVSTAVRALQVLIGANADGLLGKDSIAALVGVIADDGEELTVHSYLRMRSNHYARIVNRDPSQTKFLDGWLNRVKALQTLLIGGANNE